MNNPIQYTTESLRAILALRETVDELDEDEKVEDACGMCKGEGEVINEEGNLVPCPECTNQEYSPEI